MADVYVRLSGIPEKILNKLIKKGYFKTKSEAVRAGIIELGKEYALIGSPAFYRQRLLRQISGKKISLEEVERALKELEE